jgi:hypothetical protein
MTLRYAHLAPKHNQAAIETLTANRRRPLGIRVGKRRSLGRITLRRQRLRMIRAGITFQVRCRNENARADAPRRQLFIRDQRVQGTLTDREHLSRFTSSDKKLVFWSDHGSRRCFANTRVNGWHSGFTSPILCRLCSKIASIRSWRIQMTQA